MEIFSDFGKFIAALMGLWRAVAAGGILIAFDYYTWQRKQLGKGEVNVPRWIYGVAIVACFLVASFGTWKLEHDRADGAEAEAKYRQQRIDRLTDKTQKPEPKPVPPLTISSVGQSGGFTGVFNARPAKRALVQQDKDELLAFIRKNATTAPVQVRYLVNDGESYDFAKAIFDFLRTQSLPVAIEAPLAAMYNPPIAGVDVRMEGSAVWINVGAAP